MANYTLSPEPWLTFFYADGSPVAAGQLFTYLAGTTTPATTYSTSSGTTNTNPIILDAAGRCEVFLAPGSYRFDLFDSVAAGGALIRSEDNIQATPTGSSDTDIDGIAGTTITAGQVVYLSDGSGGLTAGRWYPAKADNAYSSTLNQVGFAVNDMTTGVTGSIRLIGRITSGLSVTVGLLYYVSAATAGAVTSTPPANARFVGEADSGTSMVVSPDPAISGITVSQGGTGAATFTSHGVLIGEGTGAIQATAAGTTGQVLTGVTGANPVFAAAVNQLTLLKQGSGTSTAAGATVVDSIAITGVTTKDTLLVYYTIESVTADTALTYLINTTDTAQLQTLCAAAGVVTAGSTFIGVSTIAPRQGSTTLIVGQNSGWGTLAAAAIAHGLRVTFATAWTGSWTLGLKHNGVTAGGTFSYTWSVYRVLGQ
jgi:hypothetical protein